MTGPTGYFSGILSTDIIPSISDFYNIGSSNNRINTIYAKNLNISPGISYGEAFTSSEVLLNTPSTYIIFDTIDFQNYLTINTDHLGNNNYLFSGIPYKKALLNISLIYSWISVDLPYRFIFGLYILRHSTGMQELIFNCISGMDDFLGNTGIFSRKVQIELYENDCIYFQILKNNNNYELKILNNSCIQVEYFF